jgi:hypothetical protein
VIRGHNYPASNSQVEFGQRFRANFNASRLLRACKVAFIGAALGNRTITVYALTESPGFGLDTPSPKLAGGVSSMKCSTTLSIAAVSDAGGFRPKAMSETRVV